MRKKGACPGSPLRQWAPWRELCQAIRETHDGNRMLVAVVLPESSAGLPGSLAGVPSVFLKREQPMDRAHCWLGAGLDLERAGGASSGQAGPGT